MTQEFTYIDSHETKGEVFVWTRDEAGVTIHRHDSSEFQYCFIPDNSNTVSGFKDMWGTPMKKCSFENKWQMREFAESEDYVCESDVQTKYRCLVEKYHEASETFPVNFCLYDIEVDFDLNDGLGYPKPENPHGEINLIQCWDNHRNQYTVFLMDHLKGVVDLKDEDYPVEMVYCWSERDMLERFAIFLNPIDLFSAWFGCVTPEHKILTADLRYVPAGDLKVGDKLLAFDEYPEKPKKRKWRESEVTFAERLMKDCCEIHLSNGEILTSTTDHPWFLPSFTGYQREGDLVQNGYHYVKAEDLKPGMRFDRMIDYWDDNRSYESGYLSGFFDGEGTVGQYKRDPNNNYGSNYSMSISGSQRENACLEETRRCLDILGYSYKNYKYDPSNRDISSVTVRGGVHTLLKFLGEVRPKRLLENFDANKLPSVKRFDNQEPVFVKEVKFVGKREIVGLSTSTKTYIVEGYGSHNSGFDLPYIIERALVNFDKEKALTMFCRDGFKATRREFVNGYGEDAVAWQTVGRKHVDMMEIYKKFTPGQRESFSLDAICREDLGMEKVQYEDEGDLGYLYRSNPQKFCEYGLHDARLLLKLNEKHNLVAVAVGLAVQSSVTYDDVVGSVKPIEMSFMKFCREKGDIVLPDKKGSDAAKFPGAIVYETRSGRHGWVTSADLAGLYPSVMIMLGLSPETVVGQLVGEYDDYVEVMGSSESMVEFQEKKGSTVTDVYEVKASDLKKVIDEMGYTVSANGTIFDGSLGLIAEYIQQGVDRRNDAKGKAKEFFGVNDAEHQRFDLLQKVLKIRNNSAYGCISNQHFRLFDINLAASITITGQMISKFQAVAANDEVKMMKEVLNAE